MIRTADALTPKTRWQETVWANIREETLNDPNSNPRLCVAALLPFRDAQPDWRSFERMLLWMNESANHFGVEITFVLNADTGYVFNLSNDLYEEVIRRFRNLYPGAPFISGVTAVGASSDYFKASCYHPHLEIAQAHKPCEVMIMTSQGL